MQSQDNNNDTGKNPENQDQDVDFHGAAIINEKGEEVPITEEMVRQACEELDPEQPQKKQDSD